MTRCQYSLLFIGLVKHYIKLFFLLWTKYACYREMTHLYFIELSIKRAAKFCRFWSHCICFRGSRCSSALPTSSLLVTNACMNCSVAAAVRYCVILEMLRRWNIAVVRPPRESSSLYIHHAYFCCCTSTTRALVVVHQPRVSLLSTSTTRLLVVVHSPRVSSLL